MRSLVLPLACVVLAGSLAACGGGGGSSATPAAGGSTGGGGSSTTSGTTAAKFAVSLQQYAPVQTSSTKRRAAFISPATAQISLTLVSVNGAAQSGAPQTFAVGPTAPNCASVNGVVNCTLSATLPLGTDVIAASTLKADNTVLGTSQITATVVQNSSNPIALAVGGTIASIEIFLSKHSFTPGSAATANVIVVPLDSSGAQIVNPGNYNPPIPVTAVNSSGATGHFSLITDGTNTGLSATINSPNDQVVLNYDGGGTSGSTTITAAPGSPVLPASTSASFNAAGLTPTPSGPQYTTTSSYVFTSPGQTGTITVSGGTGPYTITSSDPTVATVGGTSPNFSVTSVGYGTTGTATLTVTDSASATSTIPVTFIASPIVLSVASCGGGETCTILPGNTAGSVTFAIPANGASTSIPSTTISAAGGAGTFSYVFASSGTASSPYATVSQTGGSFTITPNGSSNDAIVIFSGNQSAYFGLVGTGGGASYSIGSTFLAYAVTNHTMTMGSGSLGTAQATITFSAANGPWTIADQPGEPCMSGDATVTNITSGIVIAAAANSGQCQLIFTPALGTAPTPLTIYFLPQPNVTAPVSQTMHAIGDTGSFTINNVAAMSLSDITESSGGTVISLTGFNISTGVLTYVTTGTGTSRISAHDTKYDTRLGMAVGVNSQFANSLPSAIGMTAGSAYSFTSLPSTVTSGAVYGTYTGSPTPSVTVTAGSPGSIAASPVSGSQGYGTIRFIDAFGGHADVPFTVFSISPQTYPGSSVGASALEAFTAIGQTDSVLVGGNHGTITATPVDANVVTTSVAGSTITVHAVGVGQTTIAVTDSTGASVSYLVSVTTTTIPIAGIHRHA